MTIEGADFSVWQTSTPSLTGLDFLFVKASEGLTADPRYGMHMTNGKAAGLVTSAYCFARDDVSIAAQAAFFVKTAVGASLLAVDNEGGYRMTLAQARALILAIKAADSLRRKVGLYMSASVFFDAGQDFDWIADYRAGVSHTKPGSFHQYTSTPYDRDRFNGTRAQLDALAGIPLAPDTSTEVPMGLAFRITERVSGTVTVSGPGHSLIRVDNLGFVNVPGGQVREVAARIVTLAVVANRPPGTKGYLVGNIPGSTPDVSMAAMLLETDGVFTPTAADCAAAIAADRAKAYVGWKP